MILYLSKKAVILFLSLFFVATLTFFLMHSLPGDPFASDEAIPSEVIKAINHHYGLDQPLFIQFINYLKGLFQLNLGPSLKYEGQTVNDIIAKGFPISFCLGMEALIFAVFGGIILGSIAAYGHLQWQDHLAMLLAVIGISVPSFILASFLQFFLAMKLNLLPVARWGTFSHTLLPAISLAALPMAFIARLARASLVEVMQQDYILTAKSKGLHPLTIIFKHAGRNAFLPVLTYLGPLSASILTGSFAIEKIFGIPGIGQWFVISISNRDYTLIMGMTLFYTALLLIAVFAVDVLHSFIDPRTRLQSKSYG